MAYDEELAERVREAVGGRAGITERRMFGGLAFLFGGHLGIAISRAGGLMVRMDPAAAAALVDDVSVRPMVMQGRELDGWLRVAATAVADADALAIWVDRGRRFAGSLPPKTAQRRASKTAPRHQPRSAADAPAMRRRNSAAPQILFVDLHLR